MKAQWILISTLIFALITAIFAVINVDNVRVNFIFTETELPLILVILGSTLLGGLIVGLIGTFRVFKLRRMVKQLEKQLEEQERAMCVPASPAVVSSPPSDAVSRDIHHTP